MSVEPDLPEVPSRIVENANRCSHLFSTSPRQRGPSDKDTFSTPSRKAKRSSLDSIEDTQPSASPVVMKIQRHEEFVVELLQRREYALREQLPDAHIQELETRVAVASLELVEANAKGAVRLLAAGDWQAAETLLDRARSIFHELPDEEEVVKSLEQHSFLRSMMQDQQDSSPSRRSARNLRRLRSDLTDSKASPEQQLRTKFFHVASVRVHDELVHRGGDFYCIARGLRCKDSALVRPAYDSAANAFLLASAQYERARNEGIHLWGRNSIERRELPLDLRMSRNWHRHNPRPPNSDVVRSATSTSGTVTPTHRQTQSTDGKNKECEGQEEGRQEVTSSTKAPEDIVVWNDSEVPSCRAYFPRHRMKDVPVPFWTLAGPAADECIFGHGSRRPRSRSGSEDSELDENRRVRSLRSVKAIPKRTHSTATTAAQKPKPRTIAPPSPKRTAEKPSTEPIPLSQHRSADPGSRTPTASVPRFIHQQARVVPPKPSAVASVKAVEATLSPVPPKTKNLSTRIVTQTHKPSKRVSPVPPSIIIHRSPTPSRDATSESQLTSSTTTEKREPKEPKKPLAQTAADVFPVFEGRIETIHSPGAKSRRKNLPSRRRAVAARRSVLLAPDMSPREKLRVENRAVASIIKWFRQWTWWIRARDEMVSHRFVKRRARMLIKRCVLGYQCRRNISHGYKRDRAILSIQYAFRRWKARKECARRKGLLVADLRRRVHHESLFERIAHLASDYYVAKKQYLHRKMVCAAAIEKRIAEEAADIADVERCEEEVLLAMYKRTADHNRRILISIEAVDPTLAHAPCLRERARSEIIDAAVKHAMHEEGVAKAEERTWAQRIIATYFRRYRVRAEVARRRAEQMFTLMIEAHAAVCPESVTPAMIQEGRHAPTLFTVLNEYASMHTSK